MNAIAISTPYLSTDCNASTFAHKKPSNFELKKDVSTDSGNFCRLYSY